VVKAKGVLPMDSDLDLNPDSEKEEDNKDKEKDKFKQVDRLVKKFTGTLPDAVIRQIAAMACDAGKKLEKRHERKKPVQAYQMVQSVV